MIGSASGKIARIGLAALLTGACAGLIAAGEPVAAALSPASPAGREWASFAYDPAHQQLVLFGGDNGSKALGDTWIHVRRGWVRRHPKHSPSPRTGAAMVYDGATGQLLLFGGYGGGQTWAWNGQTWTRQFPDTSPPGRGIGSMTDDTATDSGLWSWDGANWQRNT